MQYKDNELKGKKKMRFATFISENNQQAGIFYNGGYYTFNDLLEQDITLLEFIKEYESKPMPDFLAIICEKKLSGIPEDSIKLYAPIPMPFRNIICLGKNYTDHAKEVVQTRLSTQDENDIPSAPIYFTKSAAPAMGHKDVIILNNSLTKKADYEVELAVIIGKTIKNAAPQEVENAIFGYTILNDLTARDVQIKHGQWFFGKSLDGFCPMGPHIVTRDEIPFPVELNISCRVNGETRQSSNTSLLIYDIACVVSELSQGMTLFPGDIIATGTPGGIGHAMNPPVYLKKGDKVECEIEKIGVLINYFD